MFPGAQLTFLHTLRHTWEGDMIIVSHFLGHVTKSPRWVCLCMSRPFCPSYSDLLQKLIVAMS